jgi:parallel beta-helix repeat protein
VEVETLLKYFLNFRYFPILKKIAVLAISMFLIFSVPFFILADESDYMQEIHDKNWIIIDNTIIENETLILNGNITVDNGGNLKLINVILIMNCTTNRSLSIEVKNGGSIEILNSNISTPNFNDDHQFYFKVQKGAKFKMKNSGLHGCGYYSGSQNVKTIGLTIESDNCEISDSIFTNNLNAIRINGGSFVKVYNSSFYNNARGIEINDSDNNFILDNVFKQNNVGILSFSSENSSIINCEFIENNYATYLFSFKNGIIENNVYANNTRGGYHNNIMGCEFKNNDYSNNNFNFVLPFNDFNSDLNIDETNTINDAPIYYLSNLKDFEISPKTGFGNIGYLSIMNSENVIIKDLLIDNKNQGLILINTLNSNLNNINFINNNEGLILRSSSFNQITNCNFINNYIGIDIYTDSNNNIIQDSQIIDNNEIGIFFKDSSDNLITKANIIENKNGIRIDFGCENNTITKCNIIEQFNSRSGEQPASDGCEGSGSEEDCRGQSATSSGCGSLTSGGSCSGSSSESCSGLSTSQGGGRNVQTSIEATETTGGCGGSSASSNNQPIDENSNINNNDYSIYINEFSSDNKFYHNNIILEKSLVLDEGSNNKWDNGEYEGNHWSNYKGLDDGSNNRAVGDGIGDTMIPHQDLDYYPFIYENGWINYEPKDTDDDGIIDIKDIDDDDDGYSDTIELIEGTLTMDNISIPVDFDKDFKPDSKDSDIDNDGKINEFDSYPYDADRWEKKDNSFKLNWKFVTISILATIIIIGFISLFVKKPEKLEKNNIDNKNTKDKQLPEKTTKTFKNIDNDKTKRRIKSKRKKIKRKRKLKSKKNDEKIKKVKKSENPKKHS